MKTKALFLIFAVLACAAVSRGARQPTFTTFDAPGAGTTPEQGTLAYGINPQGAITGFTRGSDDVRHGFLRNRDGTMIGFDAPGSGAEDFLGTRAYAMNPGGIIGGYYLDTEGAAHGYLRFSNGGFTTFDAPGTVPGFFQGTFLSAFSINPSGTSVGYYTDENNASHGFVRDGSGVIVTFDAPGVGTSSGQGTLAGAINPEGKITFTYFDANDVGHGYIRDERGMITTFDVPGAGRDHSKALSQDASTQREPFSGVTAIAMTWVTVSFVAETARSRSSTFRAQAQRPSKARILLP
jgi:hypothetical protein